MAAKQPAYHKSVSLVLSLSLPASRLIPLAADRFVQVAPNGNETMFIAAHAKRVVGPKVWDLDKSQQLLWELIDHCTKPEVRTLLLRRSREQAHPLRGCAAQYTFSAKWHGPGDMVWWDNRTVRPAPLPSRSLAAPRR